MKFILKFEEEERPMYYAKEKVLSWAEERGSNKDILLKRLDIDSIFVL